MAGRLDEEREREILESTLELVIQHGFGQVSMDAIASRARCSKATLYRHWSNKTDLVSSALAVGVPAPIPYVATGSLRGDLAAVLRLGMSQYAGNASLLTALVHMGQLHPELGDALRRRIVDTGLAIVDQVLDQAVAHGEVPDAPEIRSHLHMAVLAPLTLGSLVLGREPDLEDLLAYVDAILLPALGA